MPHSYEDIKRAKEAMLARIQDPNASFEEKMTSSPEEQAITEDALGMATMGVVSPKAAGKVPGFENIARTLREKGYFQKLPAQVLEEAAPAATNVPSSVSKAEEALKAAFEKTGSNPGKDPAFGKVRSDLEYALRLKESSKRAQDIQRAKVLADIKAKRK